MTDWGGSDPFTQTPPSITLPRIPVPSVAENGLRRLLPLAERVILAAADAYGLGMPVRALRLGFKIAQLTAQN